MKEFDLIVCPDYDDLSKRSAQFVFDELLKKSSKKFVLGLATGRTQIGFKKEFLQLVVLKRPNLSDLYLFNLDEYWPIRRDDSWSYFQEMDKDFWQPLEKLNLGFSRERAFIPNGEAKDPCEEAVCYEELIKKHGGIDLQILGIGAEGHIGFNERGSSFDCRTRIVELSDSTREANSHFFNQNKKVVPTKAITMGIATILESKKIILLADGQRKKSILYWVIKLR